MIRETANKETIDFMMLRETTDKETIDFIMLRENQKEPERTRESQREPKRARETQRVPERARENQREPRFSLMLTDFIISGIPNSLDFGTFENPEIVIFHKLKKANSRKSREFGIP